MSCRASYGRKRNQSQLGSVLLTLRAKKAMLRIKGNTRMQERRGSSVFLCRASKHRAFRTRTWHTSSLRRCLRRFSGNPVWMGGFEHLIPDGTSNKIKLQFSWPTSGCGVPQGENKKTRFGEAPGSVPRRGIGSLLFGVVLFGGGNLSLGIGPPTWHRVSSWFPLNKTRKRGALKRTHLFQARSQDKLHELKGLRTA